MGLEAASGHPNPLVFGILNEPVRKMQTVQLSVGSSTARGSTRGVRYWVTRASFVCQRLILQGQPTTERKTRLHRAREAEKRFEGPGT